MATSTRVSVFSLGDADNYLGWCHADAALPTWLGFVTYEQGTLHLSTTRVLFDPKDHSRPVHYFPLRSLSKVGFSFSQGSSPGAAEKLKGLSFTCSDYLVGQPNDQTGPLRRPEKAQEAWSFRFYPQPNLSDFGESARALLDPQLQQQQQQGIEARLRRQETALLQGGPRCRQRRHPRGGSPDNDTASFPAWRLFPLRQQRGVLHVLSDSLVFDPLFPFVADSDTLPSPPQSLPLVLQRRQARGQGVSVQLPARDVAHVLPRTVAFHDVGFDVYACAAPAPLTQQSVVSEVPGGEEKTALVLSLRFVSAQERQHALLYMRKATSIRVFSASFADALCAWQERRLTNYQYLCFLNKAASRSTVDLSQYPVFPWVLRDYTSPALDLCDDTIYRDLSRPMGALSEDRLNRLKERQLALESVDEGAGMRAGGHYLYTTHYSSAGAVSYYLVRSHPEYQLCLQHGRFDRAQRVFESLSACWESVSTGANDYKELIPEFFQPSAAALLARPVSFSLGSKDNGQEVSRGLVLPPWAQHSPDRFGKLHADALESEYVSQHLHEWIDLVFGVKQQGEEAAASANTFHPFSYPPPPGASPVSISTPTGAGPDVRTSYAREFGCTPTRLFTSAHPPRRAASATSGEFTAVDLSHSPSLTAAAQALCAPTCGSVTASNTVSGENGEAAVAKSEVPTALRISKSSVIASETAKVSDTCFRSTHSFDISEVASVLATSTSAAAELLNVQGVKQAPFPSQLMVLSNLIPPALKDTMADDNEPDSIAGETLLTMVCDGRQGTVCIFDCLTGERLRSFSDFTSPVEMVTAFGNYVLIFTAGHDLFLVRLSSRAVVEHLEGFGSGLPVVNATCKDYFGLADTEGRVRVWRLPNDDAMVEILQSDSGALVDFELSAPVSQLCVDCNDTEVIVAAATTANDLWWCTWPCDRDDTVHVHASASWRMFTLSEATSLTADDGHALSLTLVSVKAERCVLVLRPLAAQVYRLVDGALLSQWLPQASHMTRFVGGLHLAKQGCLPVLLLGDVADHRVAVIWEPEENLDTLGVDTLFRPGNLSLSLLCTTDGLVASLDTLGSVILHYCAA